MPNFWLAKSEPETYSIEDLKRDRKTLWTGVRNYQARNYLRDGWKHGDSVLFYHSNAEPSGVVGICVVTKESVIDPSQFDPKSEYFDPGANKESPRWYAPEVKFERTLRRTIELDEMRKEPKLKGLQLLKRGNRLSILPLSALEFQNILKLEKSKQ